MTGTNPMPVDPGGLLEFSVVFTDRSLNHMSQSFQSVMRDLSATFRNVYRARAAIVVPGGGTYGMEAVARQFAARKRCLVLRNGWFSYRWTQIFEKGDIPAEVSVLKARRTEDGTQAPFVPAPIEEVEAHIREERPELVFAPHVETSSGILLPDDYLQRVGSAVREVGGLFVLDCIASGALWVDMRETGVDVLITAGANLEFESPSGATALTTALSAGQDDVVRLLIQAGADWSRPGVQEALRQRGLLEIDISKLPGTPQGARALLAEFVSTGADTRALTRQLRPETEDYAAVFVAPMADRAQAFFEPLWDEELDLAPAAGQTMVRVTHATTEELRAWSASVGLQCPGGYQQPGPHRQPELVVYEFSFVAPGEQFGTSWDGLIFINGHWAIFPMPWRLLPPR